ncbi:MAG: DUF177 domain-containing protein [Saprospiraceae bacterium]|nr:DUF177 domain-containing protein [Saprospiraceae bacterium]
MDPLISYSLPISGLRDGLHQFDFQIDDKFFETFEASAIQRGDLKVHLEFDKHPSFYALDFQIEGTVWKECDRCLEPFDLPLYAENSLKVKFDEVEREEADVVYITRERKKLNVARFIYEFIHLAIPMSTTHDMADQDCDPDFLGFLTPEAQEAEPEKQEKPSVWDALKKLKDQ